MKSLISTICLLFVCFSFSQEEEKEKQTFDTIDTILLNGKDYSVGINHSEASFKLKVSSLASDTTSLSIPKSVSKETLASVLINIVKTIDTNLIDLNITIDEKKHLLGLKKRVDAYYEKQLRKDLTEAQNVLRDIDNEKDQYSAKIILNKNVPYTNKKPIGGNGTLLRKSNQDYEIENENLTLKIIDAKLTFFNNKASSIYIKAELDKDGEKEKIIFVNNNYSVALRYFNRYGATVTSQSKGQKNITIDYNDVFDYESDQNFNYSIANSQISLSNEANSKLKPEAKVIQRRFFDYFTAVIYSDLMGFNTENSNPLLNAQAKLLVPLNLKNSDVLFSKPGKWTLFRQIYVNANIALSNSFENENRFISVVDTDQVGNFELFKRNNLYGEFGLDIFTHEAKGWFSNISFGYKTRFYRTGFRYTETQINAEDIVTNKQILSVGHGPFFSIEIRPQNNFGADITFGLEDLNFTDNNTIGSRTFKDDIISEAGRSHIAFPYNMMSLNTSFYWLTNPEKSKGGIYANLGGVYHTESKSVFPQLQVGYATNLTSFVNKFNSKKTPDVKPEK